MKPAARQFDVDMILEKVDRKMAGESNSSSSEPEEPPTANHDSVRLEEKFSKSPPKMISMTENKEQRSFLGEVCYGNFFQKHNIENQISKED